MFFSFYPLVIQILGSGAQSHKYLNTQHRLEQQKTRNNLDIRLRKKHSCVSQILTHASTTNLFSGMVIIHYSLFQI